MGVSNLALVGSGWHPPLFREEARALLGSAEILHPRMVSAAHSESVQGMISGASLVDEVIESTSRIWIDEGGISVSEIATHVEEWSQALLPEGSFAVRARNLGRGVCDLSRREIESEVGARISDKGRSVDLEDPDFEIVVVLAGQDESSGYWDDTQQNNLILWGLRDMEFTGTYNGTSPTDRPFFKPVTLDPRLARLMVSLSFSGNLPSTIVDPFCGTGGIAIEASLLGLDVLASDLDSRMVEGTKSNLDWAMGSGSHKIERCPADSIHEIWGEMEECSFVFDPPYGRNAWTSEDGLEVFLGALSSASKMCPSGTICTMLPSSPDALEGPLSEEIQVMGMEWAMMKERIRETGWSVSMVSPVRVHKSLSRLVVLCHPAH
jgi:tRNA (guanine10-N2)-dimethyltransferase